ncbi:MAG: DNA photolyase family protein [Rhodospirillum sp.]|nr:DNA photolyase family protein [Rhodospirillum sp.]MCF8488663.1 DNA photolyase family protein [Rhodospirillum sp.]MCF8503192.1 DNA photolyase family protein [Rhodospirillum sp.]
MSPPPVLLWFRQDLRLSDNPAVDAAARADAPLLALFVLEESEDHRPLGRAARWWLHGSLDRLARDIETRGGRLLLRRGNPTRILPEVITESGARSLLANQRFGAPGTSDATLFETLRVDGVSVRLFNGTLLHHPDALTTKSGTSFKVFTPFWKTLSIALTEDLAPGSPLPTPPRLDAPDDHPRSDNLEDWTLLPLRPDWAGGLRDAWTPGEAGARDRLDRFLEDPVDRYAEGRDLPGQALTSRLSPHLRFGEISPNQVLATCRGNRSPGAAAFLREVGWREFCHHLLHRNPDMAHRPLREEYTRFPWAGEAEAAASLTAWTQGRTGYPIVDASLRELWHTGWMHNRIRMIAASFLIKDLLVPWQEGERWFWDTLVDACPANNAAGWQWVAGCGADAAPFFRIFNPVTQSQKFDPKGLYLRRWLPELAALPDAALHAPWTAAPLELASAKVRLGETYPHPIIDHGQARKRALAALKSLTSPAP